MPQFEMTLSLGGIIIIAGQLCTVFIVVWNRSRVETEQRGKIDSNTARIERLEAGTKAQVEQLETETDAKFGKIDMEIGAKVAALQGAINLMRDQHHELREHLATSYMKRDEIMQMERRITDNQTALRADINKLDGKIDTMQKNVLDAIASLRVTR